MNPQAIIDAQNGPTPVLPNTSMVLILSNCKVASGLAHATTMSPPIPTAYLVCQLYLCHNPGKMRKEYDLELINIHLALPGHFDSANAIQWVYEVFQCGEVIRLGVMVHHVVAGNSELIKMYEEWLHRVKWEIILWAMRKVLDEVGPLLPESMDLA
ncbi:hypothetical protein EDD16DRAFT_1887358 [Pisolithus croceorrhizus]|nr:hypothetical protein EV401DRAFT_2136053 [Pisolithus croceorrhizus]KAI6106764.1 hypothetical protein EDD16DRAFT_1887358 [Pisolithus croceorrhizus]KAI6168897.1 hypothetical protein EDD17DRAFT_1810551 [Pisolithus thermaeus]